MTSLDGRWTGRFWRVGVPAAVCVALWLGAESAVACPTCKDSVSAADPHAQSMAAGYYYSILFMMSMPFIILGTFGTFAYRSVLKARAEQAEREAREAGSQDQA